MDAATQSGATGDRPAWHAMPAGEVEERLATDSRKGLDADQASARLDGHGPNRLPEGKRRGPARRLLAQFHNVLIYVLLAAGFTMPITASQILRVNMVTSVLLGALGADPRRQTIVA